MKKIIILILSCTLLTACGYSNNRVEKTDDKFLEKTETEIEMYLQEKYNEEFICEVEIPDDTCHTRRTITAYPESNSDLIFEIWFLGSYEQENKEFKDFYNNVRYADNLNDYFYDVFAEYFDKERLSVRFNEPLLSDEITKETFNGNSPAIYLSVSGEDEAEKIDEHNLEFISKVYEKIEFEDMFVLQYNDADSTPSDQRLIHYTATYLTHSVNSMEITAEDPYLLINRCGVNDVRTGRWFVNINTGEILEDSVQ